MKSKQKIKKRGTGTEETQVNMNCIKKTSRGQIQIKNKRQYGLAV
jgi:hypothetical protein